MDSSGATLDFLLSEQREAAAAKRFLAQVLRGDNHSAPRVINTDKHAGYPPAIQALRVEGVLPAGCEHRAVKYLNNVIEQDHRAIKRRVKASGHFRAFGSAVATLAGYEAMHVLRKGQIAAAPAGNRQARNRFIEALFGVAAERKLLPPDRPTSFHFRGLQHYPRAYCRKRACPTMVRVTIKFTVPAWLVDSPDNH